MDRVTLFIFIILNAKCILGAKILGIFPTQNFYDFSIAETIMKGLSSNGHQVTVLSNFPQETAISSYKDISLNDCEYSSMPTDLHPDFSFENATCACILTECDYTDLEEFDLLIVSMEYHSCYLRVGMALNTPVVWIVPKNQNLLANRLAGDLDPLFTVIRGNWYVKMELFIQKLCDFWAYVSEFWDNLQMESYAISLNQKIFPNVEANAPNEVDFVFYNSHSSLFPRAHVPNVIEIAGIHEPEQPICPILRRFLDTAESGVIFISTPVDESSKQMFEEKKQFFEISFFRISYRIMWKTNTSMEIPNYNMHSDGGLPQREILTHSNVEIFLSCANLHNIYDAIHTATPFIGIPCSPDQNENMARLEELGVGISLNYQHLSVISILNAITLIQQSSYAEKMQKLSTAFRDRTMTPLNTAVYWAEYAIRHNGASHMRSKSSNISLHQYLLLDVIPMALIAAAIYLYFGMWFYGKIFGYMKRKLWEYFQSVVNRFG